MTLRELFGMLLEVAGFALFFLAAGAVLMWQVAHLPKPAPLVPTWVWLVALAASGLGGAGLLLLEQWLLLPSAGGVAIFAGIRAVASWTRTAER
jgi:hypothetical protein